MSPLEPAVSLTDLGLAVENTVFVALLARHREATPDLRRWWMLFFASLALAAWLGFLSHGFFADKTGTLHRWLWAVTLLSIGVTALAASAVAARLVLDAPAAHRAVRGALMLLAVYGLAILAGYRRFGIAIVAYAPAILFLLTAFVIRARRTPARHWWLGIGGLALTMLAAAIQQLGIGLHPVHFNHNALYHVIQALALWLLYEAARRLPGDEATA
jgi:hypothetical protein